jgi:hypothetical protein
MSSVTLSCFLGLGSHFRIPTDVQMYISLSTKRSSIEINLLNSNISYVLVTRKTNLSGHLVYMKLMDLKSLSGLA